jgi:PBP1b-binding outer membrane lipoprotein LpoB
LCAYFCGTFNQEVNKMKKIYFAIAACAIFAFAACSGSTETSNADTAAAADTTAAAPEAAATVDSAAATVDTAAKTEAPAKKD